MDDREHDKSDDEPSIGAPEGHQHWNNTSGVFEEEPSLGSTMVEDQTHWADHHDREGWHCMDAEEQCDDEGAKPDDEPDHDAEGHEQARCEWFPDHPTPWPPKEVADAIRRRLDFYNTGPAAR